MKTDFLLAITQLAAERNLPKEVVFAAVEAALVTAFKKDEIGALQNISVKIHPVSGDVKVYTTKTVVEEPTDTYQEISLAEARKLKKDAQLDETISFETTSFHAGRIAAQTAKQVVLQRLREAEREFIFGEYIDREGDIVSGVVQRIEPRQVVIDLGKAEGVLPAGEQVRNERYRVGQRLKLYLLEVNRTNRGPRLIMSRSHPNLERRLFELEVPEIYNGNVELKAVAREAGYRSKVAVAAKQEGLDPVGSCVGLRGVRIQNVVNELNGERIDVIQWDAAPNVFIANALSPAQVVSVDVNEEENTAVVVVPDSQLSLAIGKEGQNARLAARLTGWRIDIKSASAAEAERAKVEKERPAVPALAEEAIEEKVEKPLALTISREQYEIALEQLGLSARTFNLLLGSGITNVGKLLEKNDKDLLGLRGFGQKSLIEVKERLGALDLRTQPSEEEIELPRDGVETIAEEILEPIEEVEEEVELVPYEPTPEKVEPSEKPQIRFAEDIFGARAIVGAEGKKKAKKKKSSREEKLEDSKARRGRRAATLTADDGYEDLSDE
ncbi:MAG: transcription termination/antitermination protein NusA [Dehalococcoidia bacterium]|nr:MAG: transcription termination/antitermination protein NusA [Dehalococcoidia bacterium]